MRHLISCVLALTVAWTGLAAADPLQLNVLPLEAPIEMAKKFKPLADHLGSALGREVQVKPGKDYAASISDVGTLKHQLAYVSPTLWAKLTRAYPDAGLELVALLCLDGKPFTNACIIVPKDSPVQSLAGLKGRSFAFGNEDSTGSHLYPRWMLKQAGIERDGGLGSFSYTGTHANVLKAVESGKADAGGLTESVARKGVESGTVRILATSDPIPEFAIVVNKAFPAELKARLLEALTGIDAGKPELAALVTPINRRASGFIKAKGDEYAVPIEIIGKLYGESFYGK
jgi:phosphonate transport system substrate-binding protein